MDVSTTAVSGYDKKDADLATLGALISTANGGGFEANPENISPLKQLYGECQQSRDDEILPEIL